MKSTIAKSQSHVWWARSHTLGIPGAWNLEVYWSSSPAGSMGCVTLKHHFVLPNSFFFFSSCLILHLWVGGDTNASTAIGRWRRAKHNDLTIWGRVTTQGSRNLLLSLGSRLWKTSGFASSIWGDVWFKLMAASNSGPSERWPCSPPTRKLLCTEDGFWGIWISWASFHLWMGSLLGE